MLDPSYFFRGGGMEMARIRAVCLLLASSVLMVSCGSGLGGTNSTGSSGRNLASPAADAQSSEAPPSGLSAMLSRQEQDEIAAAAERYLAGRQYTFLGGTSYPCSNSFEIMGAMVTDASLGPQKGKVQVPVRIKFKAPYVVPKDNPENPITMPCYVSTWAHVGQEQVVNYEFKVEKWASGWRFSQNQTNGPDA